MSVDFPNNPSPVKGGPDPIPEGGTPVGGSGKSQKSNLRITNASTSGAGHTRQPASLPKPNSSPGIDSIKQELDSVSVAELIELVMKLYAKSTETLGKLNQAQVESSILIAGKIREQGQDIKNAAWAHLASAVVGFAVQAGVSGWSLSKLNKTGDAIKLAAGKRDEALKELKPQPRVQQSIELVEMRGSSAAARQSASQPSASAQGAGRQAPRTEKQIRQEYKEAIAPAEAEMDRIRMYSQLLSGLAPIAQGTVGVIEAGFHADQKGHEAQVQILHAERDATGAASQAHKESLSSFLQLSNTITNNQTSIGHSFRA